MSLNVKKCRLCDRLFDYRGIPYCSECSVEIDEAFGKIRDYVYLNPNASTQEIITETQVRDDIVNYLIKEGRLKAIARNAFSGCQRCGKPASGAYCPECERRLAGAFGIQRGAAVPREVAHKEGTVMHTYDRSQK